MNFQNHDIKPELGPIQFTYDSLDDKISTLIDLDESPFRMTYCTKHSQEQSYLPKNENDRQKD